MSAMTRAVSTLSCIVAGHLLYTSGRLTAGSARTVTQLNASRSTVLGPHRFVVLLPMLREERIAAGTLRRFAAAVADHPAIEVVVATSESETAAWAEGAVGEGLDEGKATTRTKLRAAPRRPTTAEVVAPLVSELNSELAGSRLHHVSVADVAGTKVEKLNLALAAWRPGDVDPATTYVGVYDADSFPDQATFGLIAAELGRSAASGEPPPAIFQQVSCYCRNLRSLRGLRGLVSLADAIAQTRWALGFEYPLYDRYSSAARSARLRPLAYCVGHGCFVSLGFLDRIGGFPATSPTDDLALGYLASALGAEIAPIPALDYCEVAPDPVLSMRQSRFWFSGSARFWRDLRHARTAYRPVAGAVQQVLLHADGFGRNIAWAGRGIGWVLAFGVTLATRRWRLAVLLAGAHLAYVQGGYLQTIAALRQLPTARDRTGIDQIPRWRLAAAGVAASAAFVLRSLGPASGAVEALWRKQQGAWKLER
jgi:hypothetical protein